MFGPKIKSPKMSREEHLLSIRPKIGSIQLDNEMTTVERFQNEILRPILKLQHPIIIEYVISKANSINNKYRDLIAIEKERYLDKVVLKNPKIKQELNGMIIGQLSTKEYKIYFQYENEIKRRIYTMIKQRIVSTL